MTTPPLVVRAAPLDIPEVDPVLSEALDLLLTLSERLPADWALVGGLAVHLLAWERGATPNRPTTDADVVLGVRAWPDAAKRFTAALRAEGFRSAGETMLGRQYRWIRGEDERHRVSVDVLIPRFLGERAEGRRGVTGGTLLPTPGAQTVLSRVERVPVVIAGRDGTIPRPTLAGMILGKAAAYTQVIDDPGRARHLIDIATLAALATRGDLADVAAATTTERGRLATALAVLAATPPAESLAIDGALEGLTRLRAAAGGP